MPGDTLADDRFTEPIPGASRQQRRRNVGDGKIYLLRSLGGPFGVGVLLNHMLTCVGVLDLNEGP